MNCIHGVRITDSRHRGSGAALPTAISPTGSCPHKNKAIDLMDEAAVAPAHADRSQAGKSWTSSIAASSSSRSSARPSKKESDAASRDRLVSLEKGRLGRAGG